jgi:hypothetical protein
MEDFADGEPLMQAMVSMLEGAGVAWVTSEGARIGRDKLSGHPNHGVSMSSQQSARHQISLSAICHVPATGHGRRCCPVEVFLNIYGGCTIFWPSCRMLSKAQFYGVFLR